MDISDIDWIGKLQYFPHQEQRYTQCVTSRSRRHWSWHWNPHMWAHVILSIWPWKCWTIHKNEHRWHLYSIQYHSIPVEICPCTWCTVYRFALAEPHLYMFLRLKQGLTSFWHLSTICFKLNYWKWLKTIFVTDWCWRWFGDTLLSCNSRPQTVTAGPLQVFAAPRELGWMAYQALTWNNLLNKETKKLATRYRFSIVFFSCIAFCPHSPWILIPSSHRTGCRGQTSHLLFNIIQLLHDLGKTIQIRDGR